MKKTENTLFAKSIIFLISLVSSLASYSQDVQDLHAVQVQKLFKNKTTNEITVLQDWAKCTFSISLNLKNKEIEFIDSYSTVITWFTVVKKNEALSNETKSMVTFDCTDSKNKSCNFTISMSNNNSGYFAIIMVTYTTETGFITYSYRTKQK